MPLPAIPEQRQHRRPPREVWIVNPKLQPTEPAAAGPRDAEDEANEQPGPSRARRRTKPPDFFGVEKERDDLEAMQLDLSPTLATQLLDLPPTLMERLLSPVAPTPAEGSNSPTPPASTAQTPLATPDTSPDTSTIGPPADLHPSMWLSEDNVLPKQGQGDVLEANRHWSIGGGETEQGTHYPMLDWTPRTRRHPPSF